MVSRGPQRPQTASERRAAQRQLAKELQQGTYKPSSVGERERLVREINAYKKMVWGDRPRYNAKGANASTRRDIETGKPRSIAELRKMVRYTRSVSGVIEIPLDEDDEEIYEILRLYR